MTLVTEAVIYAAKAHDGATRRGSDIPYIVHPMEAAAIAAALGGDDEVIAAAVLHDVMEDCGATREALAERFGERVAALVEAETQNPRAEWLERRREAVARLAAGGRDEKLIALADKLSNMRTMGRDHAREGDALFARFHMKDKRLLCWYYRSCAEATRGEFGRTREWRELDALIAQVFGENA